MVCGGSDGGDGGDVCGDDGDGAGVGVGVVVWGYGDCGGGYACAVFFLFGGDEIRSAEWCGWYVYLLYSSSPSP